MGRCVTAAGLFCAAAGISVAWGQAPPIGMAPVVLTQPAYEFDTAEQHRLRVVVVAKGLPHPFSVALLPDGDALISERGGQRLLRNAVGAAGRPTPLEAAAVPGLPAVEVKYRNAGLQDIALHPQYATNHLVYFTFNKQGDLIPASGNSRLAERLSILRRVSWQGAVAAAGNLRRFRRHQWVTHHVWFRWISIRSHRGRLGDIAQKLNVTTGKVLR
jgi:glucose/arabinose dehydrogenase